MLGYGAFGPVTVLWDRTARLTQPTSIRPVSGQYTQRTTPIVSNRTASGKLASILLAGCLALCLLTETTVADQPDPTPKPPTPADLKGYRAALEDPLDSVIIAARDIERAGLILARLSALPKKSAQRIVDLWMREPTSVGMQALAVNAQLRELTIPQLEELSNADSPHLRKAAVAFFAQQPALACPYARNLSERLVDGDEQVQNAVHVLLRAQPALLDLPPETLADWLQSEDKDKRLGAVRAAALDPALARAHTHALSKRLIDEDLDVQSTAYALFQAQPELLYLPAGTLAIWLQSEDWWRRLGAVRVAALDPALARAHARNLSERLGDSDRWVQDAAYELLKVQPALLDLPAKTLEAWLQSKDWWKRLGVIRTVGLDPALAHAHVRALDKWLIDEDRRVREAVHALFQAQPALLDLPPETLADWLRSEDWRKRLGAVWVAGLDPKLARQHARNLSEWLGDQDGRIREAVHVLFEPQPDLLNLPAQTLAAWLRSRNRWQRLGAVRAATLDPKLACLHARDLSERLIDEDSDVRNAACCPCTVQGSTGAAGSARRDPASLAAEQGQEQTAQARYESPFSTRRWRTPTPAL